MNLLTHVACINVATVSYTKNNYRKIKMIKKVLDVCCGAKGMWFDKKDSRTLYLDKRNEYYENTYPKDEYSLDMFYQRLKQGYTKFRINTLYT